MKSPTHRDQKTKQRLILVTFLVLALGMCVVPLFIASASKATPGSKSALARPDGQSPAATGMTLQARVFTATGAAKPGDIYPIRLDYKADASGATTASISVVLHDSSTFVSSIPAPTSGTGTAGSPLVYNLGVIVPNGSGVVIIEAQAKTLAQDPEIIWKDISATATLNWSLGVAQPPIIVKTLGPKVATLASARYGDRPFPVVMVQYQDIKRCTGVGTPFPECTGDHTAEKLDEAVNSRTSGKSLWQLYTEMSFGQLNPIGAVSPKPPSTTAPFNPAYQHKWSKLSPNGTCTGTTLAPPTGSGTPLYPNRIENGWYNLPGTQGYYGADRTGHALGGSVTGQGVLFGVDDACGPTGKIVYDAASLADPDLDYNDFDTNKDGVVDFFNLMFAGDGGNGNTSPSGINNVWPHKSDLQFYYTDANGQTGYVSNDQLKSHKGEPMYFTDAARATMTTTVTPFPVFVRVGPYNVNPESAVEAVSVIAHEYGHSLGLPDYYSVGGRSTFGTWELMASDHAQFMTAYNRQKLGWIVPETLKDGQSTLRESKFDTGTIKWTRPDGTPYTLTGTGIHNADVFRVGLPTAKLIDAVPSGVRAWHSGSGNDFGCPPVGGHNLDFFIPDMDQTGSAAAVTLKFKSFYEIEWDYDYGFVLVSDDGGRTWTSLASQNGTTIQGFNPNASGCFTTYSNGITGVSGDPNTVANPNRLTATYPTPVFIDDQFDLTAFKGKSIILRFSYATDPGLAFRGWFIDDIEIKADSKVVYASDFENIEGTRIFEKGWSRVSTADGVDTDHAYYLEMRDRVSFDKDGKGQSERGSPTFEPGLAIVYTDENHGIGNVGVDDPPAQTIVDSAPQPGNANPSLDDASFNLTRNSFDACTHIDNYTDPNGPNELWKLPSGVRLSLTGLTGLSTDGITSAALATIIADVNPNCEILIQPPVLSIGTGYENPDTNGSYQLTWTRPAGASGPDVLQEATIFSLLLTDDAETGLTKWDTSTTGTGAFPWEASTAKIHGGTSSFWGRTAEGATNAASILTLKNAVAIPSTGGTSLTYWDFYVNEGEDTVVVEASEDSTTWVKISESARSAQVNDAALAFAEEPMTKRQFDLAPFKGKTIKIRFRFQAGPENRPASTPFGWYVDDIAIETSNFADAVTTAGTSTLISGRGTGTYYYRVRTAYPAGPVTFASAFSNVVTVNVVVPPTPTTVQFSAADFQVTEGCTVRNIAITRGGTATGTATVDYEVSGQTASQRTDYQFAAGRLTFAPGELSKDIAVLINEDAYVEGTETALINLGAVTGGTVSGSLQATLTILDNDTSASSTNPIDDPATFVCQQYHDFLNRQGDPEGQAYWTNEITKCGNDQQCIRSRRVGVSAAFFVEQEFQQTGSFVYLLYKEALGRNPTALAFYQEFMTDRNRLQAGFNLTADKQALVEDFVQRSEFVTKYPLSQTASQFVDALVATANASTGINLDSKKPELVTEYNAGSSQTNSRARAVIKLVNYPEVTQAEYVRGFVLAEYFGYLRRAAEQGGYDFWVNVLTNQEPGNYRGMVCSFITSQEYQERFGSIVTHSNAECSSIGP